MKIHLRIIMATVMLIALSGCQVGRFFIYNFADIRDYKKFPSRKLYKSDHPFTFIETDGTRQPKKINVGQKGEVPFDEFLSNSKTVAFIIIKDDSVLYEKYFHGYDRNSIVPSFSMAKSVTSILIGCAIADGHIRSVDEPVTNYVPELKGAGFDKVTIKHLLQMTSGLRYSESYYSPFSGAAAYYYGRNLRRKMARMKLKQTPGTHFAYSSGTTQLLGLVLERALKNRPITSYLQDKVWSTTGMEFDASWSIDKKNNGIEKTFCCINARARDFAKIGRLYLNNGSWNGTEVVPASWVKESTKIDTTNASPWYYQYQWWVASNKGDYLADGHLGQYIYVNPAKHMVIVRLGKREGKVPWWSVFKSLAAGY